MGGTASTTKVYPNIANNQSNNTTLPVSDKVYIDRLQTQLESAQAAITRLERENESLKLQIAEYTAAAAAVQQASIVPLTHISSVSLPTDARGTTFDHHVARVGEGSIINSQRQTEPQQTKQKSFELFLSYTQQDEAATKLVNRLGTSLREQNLKYTQQKYHPEDGRQSSVDQSDALHQCHQFVFLLSPNSFSASNLSSLLLFREAIRMNMRIILITVEGSRWLKVHDFPPMELIPSELHAGLNSKAIDHVEELYPEFLQRLVKRIKTNCRANFIQKDILDGSQYNPRKSDDVSVRAPIPNGASVSASNDKVYDFFLSHKRAEAQDFCRGLRESLKETSYSCFLDQEDDAELSSLMTSVARSRSLVFILSLGIFRSDWCLKELVAAIRAGIQIVFVKYDGCQQMTKEDIFAQLAATKYANDFLPILQSSSSQSAFQIVTYNRNYHNACVEQLTRALGPSRQQLHDWPIAITRVSSLPQNDPQQLNEFMQQHGSWSFAVFLLSEIRSPAGSAAASRLQYWINAQLERCEVLEEESPLHRLVREQESILSDLRKFVAGVCSFVNELGMQLLLRLPRAALTEVKAINFMVNQPIDSLLAITPSVTQLLFGQEFNQSVNQLKLPPLLTHLTFGDKFNQPADKLALPTALTHLEFPQKFNHAINSLVLRPLSRLQVYGCVLLNVISWDDITSLTFGERFNQPVDQIILPSSLTKLAFGRQFNQPIDRLMLSKSLTELTFGVEFNQPLDDLILPPALTTLEFGNAFNQPVEELILPASLTHLIFGYGSHFNQPVDKLALPASLSRLVFGDKFNQPVNGLKLPATLSALEFGEDFDQPVNQLVLPSSLQQLKFGISFNQTVDQLVLPESLSELIFRYYFNQPVDKLKLPSSLTKLHFGSSFCHSLKEVQLPLSLTHLTLGGDYNESIEGVALPISLLQLVFGAKFNQPIHALAIPPSLTRLSFGSEFNQPVDRLVLPSTLKQLAFGAKFNQPIDKLTFPPSLTELTLGENFNQPVDQVTFPSQLTRFTFSNNFNQPIDRLKLPAALIELAFGDCFNQPIDDLVLPPCLTNLTFGEAFNQPVAKSIFRSSLKQLTFGSSFNQTSDKLNLPPSLTSLTFGNRFNQSVDTLSFPSSLTELTFGHDFDQPIDKVVLPPSLQRLTFGYAFHQSVDNLILPQSLVYLTFGEMFRNPIDKLVLPPSLKELQLGEWFNEPVDKLVLPASLEQLSFGDRFNQPVDKLVLPHSLSRLKFGYMFNQPVDKLTLSPSLTQLLFGKVFNQPVDKLALPLSLTRLAFGMNFQQSLDQLVLPPLLSRDDLE